MSSHPFYKTTAWRHLRTWHLSREPLCRRCRDEGRLTAATVVHHLRPHRGDWDLFRDPSNLASSCKRCHDSTEQGIEARGYDKRIGEDGWPADERHPFNRIRRRQS